MALDWGELGRVGAGEKVVIVMMNSSYDVIKKISSVNHHGSLTCQTTHGACTMGYTNCEGGDGDEMAGGCTYTVAVCVHRCTNTCEFLAQL